MLRWEAIRSRALAGLALASLAVAAPCASAAPPDDATLRFGAGPISQTTNGPADGASAPAEALPTPSPLPAVEEAGITLAGLEELALRQNPTLAQGQALIQQARGNWLQVGLYPNPIIGYQSEEIGDGGTAGKHGGFIQQNIVTGNKLGWNRAVARQDLDRARWQWQAQQLRVLNSVRVQYYQALGAQRTAAVAENLLSIAQQGVTTAEQLVAVQEAPRTDVLQAQVELSNVQLLVRTVQHQQRAARRALAAVVGVSELPPRPLAGELEWPGAIPELAWEDDLARLWNSSPVLQIAHARVARARAQLQRERVQPIPDLGLQAGVMHDFEGDQVLASAQAGIMLPIYNKNQGNIAAAAAELHRATADVERLQLVLQRGLAEAHQRYAVARSQVELYRDAILPKAQETLQLTTKAYDVGELDFFRVLTARRTYGESYVEYVRALVELRAALIEIDGLLLTGGLDDVAEAEFPSGGGGGGTRPLTVTPRTE